MMFFQRISKRSIHLIPRSRSLDQFSNQGIQGLMSKEQFNLAWNDHQNYLLKNLTLRTVGTQYETMSPYGVLMSTARNGLESNIFHFASQAHNNHLFFQQLTTAEQSQNTVISEKLLDLIKAKYTHFDYFKNSLLQQADLLSGQGYVFLIENENKELDIISCHNDGTPYNFLKSQSLDLNGAISLDDYKTLAANKAKAQDKESRNEFNIPLLCINVWDHCYLLDYGVNGRADYLEKIFDHINWDVVNKRLFEFN